MAATEDLYLAQVAGYLPGVAGVAPKPGAILLQANDISQANGLDPASLRRVFFTPLSESEGGRLATVSTLLGQQPEATRPEKFRLNVAMHWGLSGRPGGARTSSRSASQASALGSSSQAGGYEPEFPW